VKIEKCLCDDLVLERATEGSVLGRASSHIAVRNKRCIQPGQACPACSIGYLPFVRSIGDNKPRSIPHAMRRALPLSYDAED